MITKLFRQLGVTSEDGRMWNINGIIWDGKHDADAIDAVTQEAVRHIWKKLSKTRHHFQGLEKGRNNRLSNKEKRIIKHPVNRGRWQMIQADGIHTPWRRRQKAGGDGVCPRCGCGQGDLEHMIWECPETLRRATEEHRYLARIRNNMGKEPRCLWALGHIPAEWEYDTTEQTHQQPVLIDWEVFDETNPVEKIGTDGGEKTMRALDMELLGKNHTKTAGKQC